MSPLTRSFIARRTLTKHEASKERRTKAARLLKRIEAAAPGRITPDVDDIDGSLLPVLSSGGAGNIYADAAEAEARMTIDKSRIVAARAEKEELELKVFKKDLAPIGLMIHWFSFSEALFAAQYSRFSQIMPQLEALILGHDSKGALQLLRREMEGIIKKSVQDLQNDIQREGYNRVD